MIPEFLEEFGVPYIIRELRKSAFSNNIPLSGFSVPKGIRTEQYDALIREIDLTKDTAYIVNPTTPSLLLIGKKSNEWSNQAERLLTERKIPYRFETISTPPHPNPENCPGADPDIRAIPTLLRDYDTVDGSGDTHHIRTPLAWGLEEIERWVEAQEVNNDV